MRGDIQDQHVKVKSTGGGSRGIGKAKEPERTESLLM
jgi:hypothetical protein